MFLDTKIVHNKNFKIIDSPIQEKIEIEKIKIDDFEITKKAKYSGIVLIEGKENYHFDEFSKIVPTDLIFVWGEPTKQSNREKINYSQSNRWYFFNTEDITQLDVIQKNSANTHIVANSAIIKEELSNISKGDVIAFYGFLVDVSKDEKKIRSSETRFDTGAGACEILLLTDIQIITDQYIQKD